RSSSQSAVARRSMASSSHGRSGASTVCPRARSRSATRCQDQPTSPAPWISRKVAMAPKPTSGPVTALYDAGASGLAQEHRLEHQPLDLVRVALDVPGVVLDQANVADHRPLLERDRAALHLEVLDHMDGVALLQQVAVAVADFGAGYGRRLARDPLVRAIRADELRTVGIGVAAAAPGAVGEVVHGMSRIYERRTLSPTAPNLR